MACVFRWLRICVSTLKNKNMHKQCTFRKGEIIFTQKDSLRTKIKNVPNEPGYTFFMFGKIMSGFLHTMEKQE